MNTKDLENLDNQELVELLEILNGMNDVLNTSKEGDNYVKEN